jgi:hypothetical protein
MKKNRGFWKLVLKKNDRTMDFGRFIIYSSEDKTIMFVYQ